MQQSAFSIVERKGCAAGEGGRGGTWRHRQGGELVGDLIKGLITDKVQDSAWNGAIGRLLPFCCVFAYVWIGSRQWPSLLHCFCTTCRLLGSLGGLRSQTKAALKGWQWRGSCNKCYAPGVPTYGTDLQNLWCTDVSSCTSLPLPPPLLPFPLTPLFPPGL